MDNCWTLWSIHHYKFEKIPRSVRSKYQIPDRIVGDLFDNQRVVKGMSHVVGLDAVTKGRMENLHK
jgi:hypothetical protein